MSGLATALGFLTVIPAGGGARLRSAAVWFPLVGLLVGGAAGGLRLGLDPLLGAAPATVLALAAAVLLTRGLHEDGLADTADGLGVHADRERRLAAMRDPFTGAHGTLALAFCLALSATALAGLDAADAARALVTGHVLARWSMLAQARALPPCPGGALGERLTVATPALAIASAMAAAIAVAACGPAAGGATLAAAVLATLLAVAGLRHLLGGRTGDTLGAVGKLVEVTTFAVLLGAWR